MRDTMIKDLLETIADITGEVSGAYNLRSNGCGVETGKLPTFLFQ